MYVHPATVGHTPLRKAMDMPNTKLETYSKHFILISFANLMTQFSR